MALVIPSHARARGARKGPALFGICLLLCTAAAGAGVSVDVRKENIAVVAERATVRSILEALAEARVINVTASIPLQSPVSLQTGPEPLPLLLRRLLRPYSYTLIEYDASSGRLPRLHVFNGDDATAPLAWASHPSTGANPIDLAIADLAHPDADVREEAVLTLSDSGDPDVVTHFFSALSDRSPDVREAARAALEDMDTAVPEAYEGTSTSRQRD